MYGGSIPSEASIRLRNIDFVVISVSFGIACRTSAKAASQAFLARAVAAPVPFAPFSSVSRNCHAFVLIVATSPRAGDRR